MQLLVKIYLGSLVYLGMIAALSSFLVFECLLALGILLGSGPCFDIIKPKREMLTPKQTFTFLILG